ncbi:MAG: hypothetical protein ACRD4H_02385 [Candidatus Acidiferrales bacterium]
MRNDLPHVILVYTEGTKELINATNNSGANLDLHLFVSAASRSRQRAAGEQNCTIVKEALDTSSHLIVGVTRREVDKNFKLDGGMQSFSTSRYVYSKCEYIKLDIDFKHAVPGNPAVPSPDDTVVKISKPYLQYPMTD